MQRVKALYWGGPPLFIFMLGGPFHYPALAADSEVRIGNRTEFIYYNTEGPGRDASFYQDGAHILHETDIRTQISHASGWNSTLDLAFRLTDNDQFDPETASVERFSLALEKDRLRFDAGDYFANFSQYSMNKSIKGLAAQLNFEDRNDYLRVAYGIFDSQWEYLYDDADNEPMDRWGGGLRYQRAGEKYRLGLNLAFVEDDESDDNRGSENAYRQWLPALDWEYRLPSVVVAGESAYSDTEEKGTASATEPTGTAHRITARARFEDLKIRAKWERVSPEFISLGGGATPDRHRIYTKADADLTRNWDVFGIFDYSEDNLDDQLTRTTENTTGELGVRWKRAFSRRTLQLSLSGRRKWRDTSDNSSESVSDRIKFGVSDRLFRTVRFNGDFESIINDDTTPGGTSLGNYFYNVSFSSRHRLLEGDLELRPRLVAGLQERENATTGGDDTTSNLRLDFSGIYLKNIRVGVNLERTNNDLDDPAADDSLRTRYGAYCEYRPPWLDRGSFRLEGANNDYDFDDNSKDYREEIVKLVLRYDFDRKGGGK